MGSVRRDTLRDDCGFLLPVLRLWTLSEPCLAVETGIRSGQGRKIGSDAPRRSHRLVEYATISKNFCWERGFVMLSSIGPPRSQKPLRRVGLLKTCRSSAVVVFLLLAALATPAPASSTTNLQTLAIPIPPSFFDLNVLNLEWGGAWPTVKFYGWRDGHSVWLKVEPQKGQWDFKLLDHDVDLAERHGVEIMLLLGTTPTWASARPQESGCCGPKSARGSTAEAADLSDWRNYVTKLAGRYKGRVHLYELWNEPDEPRFYSGTPEKLAVLNREAYQALKKIDPSITVVSSSLSGSAKSPEYLDRYFAAGGGNSADVIGYHFYAAKSTPEAMLPKIAAVRDVMRHHDLKKPLWNTETGWHFANHDQNDPAESWLGPALSDDDASAYLARSYILSWAAGIERLYWYAWGETSMGLTEHDKRTPKPVAQAYDRIREWLLGATMKSCTGGDASTWSCQLTRKDGSSAWIVWNTDGHASLPVPKSWKIHQVTDLTGSRRAVRDLSSVEIGTVPLLLE